MNIPEIVKILTDSGIEQGEANAEVKLLIEHFCGITALGMLMGQRLDYDKLAVVAEKAKIRAQTRRPIQHIMGVAHFMGEKFSVNPEVLIPRDETELLVRQAVKIIKANGFQTALDVGTGSGCIACMVAKLTDAQVIGVDISAAALQTALDNATKLRLNNKAVFRKSDVFSNVTEKFDVIISNPPYIPSGSGLQDEVGFDPPEALFCETGFEFFQRITVQAPTILNRGGYLMFETGKGQAREVKSMMGYNGFENIEILCDLAGIERVVSGRITNN
jgi:release factor glutamine methyltransferase